MSVPNPTTTDWVPIYAGAPSFDYLGDYVPDTEYKDGDIVMYNGVPWLAVKPTTTPPDPFPIAGGAQLTYEGAHVPTTEYSDGDIVVKDGIAFMCVGGPTTDAPNPAAWGSAGLYPDAPALTLPVSPVDGQRALLRDAPYNFIWQFRYDVAAEVPYRWIFMGGTPYVSEPLGNVIVSAANTWTDLTNGPQFTAPCAGWYFVRVDLMVQNTAGYSTPYDSLVRFKRPTTGPTTQQRMFIHTTTYSGGRGTYQQWVELAKDEILTIQACITVAAGTTFSQANLEILPWGVS
jgi:hypothetical protein